MISVFDFEDYKAYIVALEEQRASVQRGFRSRLAETLNCQNAYISQVLNGNANLGLEQGLKVARFFQLNEAESRYFLNLIELARAGTSDLQDYFRSELTALKQKHLNIKERLSKSKEISPDHQNVYYSSWLYPTVHMMVTVPQYRSVESIAAALRLANDDVRNVVLFLLSTDLVREQKGELLPGPAQIHLGKDSPHIRQHHTNWRVAAIQNVGRNHEGIHYSTVSSLSRKDAETLKGKFVAMIKEYVETVSPSKEETIYNFNLDFYRLIQD
jgi:uncharacterized protein (TIGR02147 family)